MIGCRGSCATPPARPVRISGHLVDTAGSPLAYPTVALISTDWRYPSVIPSISSPPDGSVEFHTLHGEYELLVEGGLAFSTVVRPIDARSSDVIDVGTIVMKPLPEPPATFAPEPEWSALAELLSFRPAAKPSTAAK